MPLISTSLPTKLPSILPTLLIFVFSKIIEFSISFFSGIILFSQGIIGIYIARIFEQVKGRKRYVIKDIKEIKNKIIKK